jgi:hypothetical protein
LNFHNDSSSITALLKDSNFSLRSYTSLRIYWKIYDDSRDMTNMQISDKNICKDKSKAFYLCNGDDVYIFNQNDIDMLRKNSSEAITQRLFGTNTNFASARKLEKRHVNDVEMSKDPVVIKSNEFWTQIVNFIKYWKQNFSFVNIDFKYKTFTGEEKFPIQFWNTAKPDTKDKLLSSVESHWLLAKSYELFLEKNLISADLWLENLIKINHRKEKISSLFCQRQNVRPSLKSSNFQSRYASNIQEGKQDDFDDYDTVIDQRNLPMSMRYRRYRETLPKVEVGPSKIHCQGLFALEHFSQNDIVIEYVGEVISNKEADKREILYEK